MIKSIAFAATILRVALIPSLLLTITPGVHAAEPTPAVPVTAAEIPQLLERWRTTVVAPQELQFGKLLGVGTLPIEFDQDSFLRLNTVMVNPLILPSVLDRLYASLRWAATRRFGEKPVGDDFAAHLVRDGVKKVVIALATAAGPLAISLEQGVLRLTTGLSDGYKPAIAELFKTNGAVEAALDRGLAGPWQDGGEAVGFSLRVNLHELKTVTLPEYQRKLEQLLDGASVRWTVDWASIASFRRPGFGGAAQVEDRGFALVFETLEKLTSDELVGVAIHQKLREVRIAAAPSPDLIGARFANGRLTVMVDFTRAWRDDGTPTEGTANAGLYFLDPETKVVSIQEVIERQL